MTLLLRGIDAITDFSLTTTYFQSMDTVIEEFLRNSMCRIHPNLNNTTTACSNVTFVKNICIENKIWNRRLVCSFPLMRWWISGVLSAAILVFAYLVEVIVTLFSKHFDHYLEIYSRVCCRQHNKGAIIVYGLILPLSQQMTSLVYNHCIKVIYVKLVITIQIYKNQD